MKKNNVFLAISMALVMMLSGCGNPSPSKGDPSETPKSEPTSQAPISEGKSETPSTSEDLPIEVRDVNVKFNNVTDNVMVNPKVKAYIDAMREQERTLEHKYRISDLYGEDGVDVCKMLSRNDYNNTNKPIPITVSWSKEGLTYDKVKVSFSTKEDMSDARSVTTTGTSAQLDNLYANTKYYYQIETEGNPSYKSQVATFETADYVRMINLGGIYNVRDLGGYNTSYGKRTKQGLVYRGSEINVESYSDSGNQHNKNVDDTVLQIQKEVLHIGTEIDFRSAAQGNNITACGLGDGAGYSRQQISAYHNFINDPQNCKEIFEILANADKSHVYFHCWGGADRTGTIAFLLNAICGVSYTDLIMDFEYTTQTNNERCFKHESSNAYFPQFLEAFTGLSYYDANKTVNQNACAFLKAQGVTDATIEKIRTAMIDGYQTGMEEQEEAPVVCESTWTTNDLGHWHKAADGSPVRVGYASHNFVVNEAESQEANCAQAGKTVKTCSECGKTVTTEIARTGHTFVANGEATGKVHPEIDNGCGMKAYRLDIAEATGWHDPNTKWNAKSGTDAEASWDITGQIPAGKYELYLEAVMSYQSHSDRTFYNQWETDTASSPDTQDQSPFRYFFKVDGGDNINPDTRKTWGELGYNGKSNGTGVAVFAPIVSEVVIPEGATTFTAAHGNIGYSLIISRVRLVEIK